MLRACAFQGRNAASRCGWESSRPGARTPGRSSRTTTGTTPTSTGRDAHPRRAGRRLPLHVRVEDDDDQPVRVTTNDEMYSMVGYYYRDDESVPPPPVPSCPLQTSGLLCSATTLP